jgi:hypothetical protein
MRKHMNISTECGKPTGLFIIDELNSSSHAFPVSPTIVDIKTKLGQASYCPTYQYISGFIK